MKRILLLFFCFLSSTVWAQSQERILNYDVTLSLDTLGKLTVLENIKVNATGDQIKRGIYRTLPSRRFINDQDISIKYDVISVLKNGQPEVFNTEREDGEYKIYIGSEDVFLDPGIYEYEITYKTYRQVGYFEGFDELYWNVTGNHWAFPIEKASARIILPSTATLLQNACYTGAEDSKDQNCSSTVISENQIIFSTENLAPNEGLTVAAGFEKGAVSAIKLPVILEGSLLSKIMLFLGAILTGLMYFFWNRYGKDHISPTVYPQFEVPDHLSPASMGYLFNGYYRSNFIASSLINLAIKGFLHISEPEKKGKDKFTLTKRKAESLNIAKEEEGLLRDLFKNEDSEITIDGEYNPTIQSAVSSYQTTLRNSNQPILNSGNNWKKVLWIFLGISLVYWIVLGYSHAEIFDVQKFKMGIGLYVGAVFTFILIVAVRIQIAKYIWLLPLFFSVGTFYLYTLFSNSLDAFGIIYLFLTVNMTLLAIFNFLIKQPSKELLDVKSRIEGFKMYLETAESELIKFYNPPQITPEIFEKYLPYALVLGVDGVWGKKFEASLQSKSESYDNHWYSSGSTIYSTQMTHMLSKSLSTTVTSSSVNPSSSGSSGGGSSGGGGGGGGGGGW
jgi:uncharacterized membrane protein YgcG